MKSDINKKYRKYNRQWHYEVILKDNEIKKEQKAIQDILDIINEGNSHAVMN